MTLSLIVRMSALGLAAAVLSVSTAEAAAPDLVSSSPGASDGWTPFPKQLRLSFNQALAANGHDIQLMDPDGRRIRLTAPVVSKQGLTVTPELSGGPPVNGPYMVVWEAKSASGEQGKGQYTFFVQ
ncbi:MAG: copper resistance CopC family protein [Caulobacteraceae bacterium]